MGKKHNHLRYYADVPKPDLPDGEQAAPCRRCRYKRSMHRCNGNKRTFYPCYKPKVFCSRPQALAYKARQGAKAVKMGKALSRFMVLVRNSNVSVRSSRNGSVFPQHERHHVVVGDASIHPRVGYSNIKV